MSTLAPQEESVSLVPRHLACLTSSERESIIVID